METTNFVWLVIGIFLIVIGIFGLFEFTKISKTLQEAAKPLTEEESKQLSEMLFKELFE